MFAVVIRVLLAFLIPSGLIFAAAVLIVTTGIFADSLPVLVGFYRYAVLVAGLMLGWRFGRSRLAFAVLVLAVSDTALQQFAAGSVGIEGVGGVMRNSIALLLPLNLVFFSYIKERGFLSLRGAMRFGLILIEIAGIFLLCRHLESRIVTFLDYQPITSDLLMSAPLSLPALLAFIAASLLISVRYIQQRNPLEGGFIWAFVMVFYALTQVEIGIGSTFYLSTAGFILRCITEDSAAPLRPGAATRHICGYGEEAQRRRCGCSGG